MSEDNLEELTQDKAAAALMIRIMQQNANDAAHLGNSLVESYQRDYSHARAELAAIRTRITILFRGRYLPNPDLVLNALYPAEEEIVKFLEET